MHFTEILKKFSSFFFLACFLALLGGCAGLYGLREDPRISIADIRIVDARPMETVFLVQLRILNPNDTPLDLHGIHCNLEIDGRHFASGIAASDQVVPAHGTATIPVHLYASVFDMISSVVDFIRATDPNKNKESNFSYTLHGTVGIGTHRSRKQIPFHLLRRTLPQRPQAVVLIIRQDHPAGTNATGPEREGSRPRVPY
jgi:LEA14-like dessication related protein